VPPSRQLQATWTTLTNCIRQSQTEDFRFYFFAERQRRNSEHWWEKPNPYFPYYVQRSQFEPNRNITWNANSHRFRGAFDHDDYYDTRQVATGITDSLDGQNLMEVKIMRNWRDDQLSSRGVSLGLKQCD